MEQAVTSPTSSISSSIKRRISTRPTPAAAVQLPKSSKRKSTTVHEETGRPRAPPAGTRPAAAEQSAAARAAALAAGDAPPRSRAVEAGSAEDGERRPGTAILSTRAKGPTRAARSTRSTVRTAKSAICSEQFPNRGGGQSGQSGQAAAIGRKLPAATATTAAIARPQQPDDSRAAATDGQRHQRTRAGRARYEQFRFSSPARSARTEGRGSPNRRPACRRTSQTIRAACEEHAQRSRPVPR